MTGREPVLRHPGGARHARLMGIGEYRPDRVVGNAEIAGRIESSDEWIRTRTGIVSRRVAGPAESVVSMAADAAAKALAAAGLDAGDVDLVVLATCTIRDAIPGGAARVATAIGAPGTGAFDLNGACGGFCYALSVAADAVRAGSAGHVVVVGSEKLSDWLDWDDRATSILFGDGAAAVVVGPAEEPGIGPVVWGSDGGRADLVGVPDGDRFLRMDGPAVFRWATTSLAPVARAACERAGVGVDDVDAIVLHQANARIVDAVVRALGRPRAVVADDIAGTGNASAASVPLALSALAAQGAVRTGDLALLLAFGAGLTYAGQVVRVP